MIGFDFVKSKIFKGKNHKENFVLNDNLPPIFKLFINNFDWTENTTSTSLYFLPYLQGGEVYLKDWNYKKIFSKSIIENDPWMEENGFISIASSNKGIFLGIKDYYKDKIVSTEYSLDDSIVIIADNIFEFVRGLTDNVTSAAESSEEYRKYMIDLGYEKEDLEKEVNDWLEWKEFSEK